MRHVIAALLVILILSAWAADAFDVKFIPRPLHDAIAEYTDPILDSLPLNHWAPGALQAVGRNPIDGSPITAWSVLLLGVISGTWLGVSRGSAMFKEEG